MLNACYNGFALCYMLNVCIMAYICYMLNVCYNGFAICYMLNVCYNGFAICYMFVIMALLVIKCLFMLNVICYI